MYGNFVYMIKMAFILEGNRFYSITVVGTTGYLLGGKKTKSLTHLQINSR